MTRKVCGMTEGPAGPLYLMVKNSDLSKPYQLKRFNVWYIVRTSEPMVDVQNIRKMKQFRIKHALGAMARTPITFAPSRTIGK